MRFTTDRMPRFVSAMMPVADMLREASCAVDARGESRRAEATNPAEAG
jgi:hypothetical protein